VAIYPPPYYQSIAWPLRLFNVKNTLAAAYGARFISALWLGMAGILWDAILGFVLKERIARLGALVSFALFIPTLGMLGGAICNDIAADSASLGIFLVALWNLKGFPHIC
jgi:hypothetical protein